MSLKQKTILGLQWSFIDSFASQGIQFIVGIILARILSPNEFGLIGLLTIFIAVSQSFIDSGFRTALIRKNICTQSDYSTVFYFNIAVSIICYIILFISSGAISSFFHEHQLKAIIQVLGLGLILNSFAIIQQTIYTRELNFKLQMWISVISSLGSGLVAVIMALSGIGVWSLVALTLCRYGFTTILLWAWSKWKPDLIFSKASFFELFSFGSKILASGLLDTIFRNIYYAVIGKYFSATELGYYSRADQFQSVPSTNLQDIIGRVTYPVLSSIQNDKGRLRTAYIQLIRSTMLITFVFMFGMAAVANSMIITLIGIKWEPCIIYLQMLCIVGLFYPLHALNLNMLKVQGRSDLFLQLEIIKKILTVPTIIAGIFLGIKIMIIGMLLNTMVAYYINSYWSGKYIGYTTGEQIKDILPSFFLAVTMGVIVFLFGKIINIPHFLKLIIQIILGASLTIGIAELIQLSDYLYIKEIVVEKLFKKRKV